MIAQAWRRDSGLRRCAGLILNAAVFFASGTVLAYEVASHAVGSRDLRLKNEGVFGRCACQRCEEALFAAGRTAVIPE